MYLGIEKAVPENRIGDIGHGIGPTVHENPSVPHYGEAGKGLRLKEGMTITIEPMVNTGTWKLKMDNNGWTARIKDGGLSCQLNIP